MSIGRSDEVLYGRSVRRKGEEGLDISFTTISSRYLFTVKAPYLEGVGVRV
jgi:hypothetical protein